MRFAKRILCDKSRTYDISYVNGFQIYLIQGPVKQHLGYSEDLYPVCQTLQTANNSLEVLRPSHLLIQKV
jgi:hypothetical protein